ncbi:hypothetical protein, partial [Streptomyces rhizosphaericus]|uniref:hypothetical protein n=1 Tax=Streptomyces rhizosphaericus TaxID=114699 RepID=UPI0019D1C5B9
PGPISGQPLPTTSCAGMKITNYGWSISRTLNHSYRKRVGRRGRPTRRSAATTNSSVKTN